MKDDARDIEFPGQAVGVSFFFEQMRGYFDSALEGQVLSAATGQQAVTFDAVTQALAAQGGQLVLITQDNLNVLDGLSLSADAKARITQEVESGMGVVAPSQMVTINGQSTVEWLQVNFATGQVISVAPDGAHQAAIEYAFELDNPLNVAATAFIGTMDGFAVSQLKFIGLFLGGIASGKDLVEVVRDAKLELATDLAKDYISLLAGAIPVPESLPEWAVARGRNRQVDLRSGGQGRSCSIRSRSGAEVIKLILGKTLPGFSNLSLAFDAGMVAGSAYGIYYIATTLPGDPPLFPALTTELASASPLNFASGTETVAASLCAAQPLLDGQHRKPRGHEPAHGVVVVDVRRGVPGLVAQRLRRDGHRCEREGGRVRRGRAGRGDSDRRGRLGQRSVQRQRHRQPLLLRPGRDQPRRQRRLDELLGDRHRRRLDHAHDRRPHPQRRDPPRRDVHDHDHLGHAGRQRAEHLAELRRLGRRSPRRTVRSTSGRGPARLSVGGSPLDPERRHPGRLHGHDHRLGQRRRHRCGLAQRQRGQRPPGHGQPRDAHDRPEHARHVRGERPDQPRRYLQPHGQRPAGLDGHHRQQRQRHRDARARAPERHVSDPDHRAVADRSQPRRADDRRGDDHAHAAGHQLHRRPRPALHRALQRRRAPHAPSAPRSRTSARPPTPTTSPSRTSPAASRSIDSGTSVTVPAGATGIVGIYLVPNTGQPLPAPGTQLSFTVTATSTTNSVDHPDADRDVHRPRDRRRLADELARPRSAARRGRPRRPRSRSRTMATSRRP